MGCNCRTLIGAHYLFRRFSYSSRENTWKKVMGRRTRGRDLWSVDGTPGVFFYASSFTYGSFIQSVLRPPLSALFLPVESASVALFAS